MSWFADRSPLVHGERARLSARAGAQLPSAQRVHRPSPSGKRHPRAGGPPGNPSVGTTRPSGFPGIAEPLPSRRPSSRASARRSGQGSFDYRESDDVVLLSPPRVARVPSCACRAYPSGCPGRGRGGRPRLGVHRYPVGCGCRHRGRHDPRTRRQLLRLHDRREVADPRGGRRRGLGGGLGRVLLQRSVAPDPEPRGGAGGGGSAACSCRRGSRSPIAPGPSGSTRSPSVA